MKLRPFVMAAVAAALLAGLTACAPDPPAPPGPPPGCYVGTSSSLRLTGELGTLGNARLHESADCSGIEYALTIVSVPEFSLPALMFACQAVPGFDLTMTSTIAGPVANLGYTTVPPDWAFC